ncbi:Uncharacterized protein Rs2_05144 [Raphanus sativus]|nr:Uncharacterized protein Rs2_05144 [Raphanus sativus]
MCISGSGSKGRHALWKPWCGDSVLKQGYMFFTLILVVWRLDIKVMVTRDEEVKDVRVGDMEVKAMIEVVVDTGVEVVVVMDTETVDMETKVVDTGVEVIVVMDTEVVDTEAEVVV